MNIYKKRTKKAQSLRRSGRLGFSFYCTYLNCPFFIVFKGRVLP